MADTNSNTQQLSQLMKRTKLTMPFSDFEETVMHRIQLEANYKKVLTRDRKLSFLFFILGTVLGLTINSFLQKAQYTFLAIPPDTMLLIFQVAFVLIFLFQLEKNLHFIKKWKQQLQRL